MGEKIVLQMAQLKKREMETRRRKWLVVEMSQ
jgi:hypothetical protein